MATRDALPRPFHLDIPLAMVYTHYMTDYAKLNANELIQAYVNDALSRSVGVDYYIAAEVDRRGSHLREIADFHLSRKAL